MGHAPHPTQSLVNSCEEFYQAKQLFILTQGKWHVLAKLQKVSSVPKCKNILRIAKKNYKGDRVQIKFVVWFMARSSSAHKHIQGRLISAGLIWWVLVMKSSLWSHWEHWHTKTPFLRGVERVCTSWGFSTKYLQAGAWPWCSIISKLKGNYTLIFLWGTLPISYLQNSFWSGTAHWQDETWT